MDFSLIFLHKMFFCFHPLLLPYYYTAEAKTHEERNSPSFSSSHLPASLLIHLLLIFSFPPYAIPGTLFPGKLWPLQRVLLGQAPLLPHLTWGVSLQGVIIDFAWHRAQLGATICLASCRRAPASSLPFLSLALGTAICLIFLCAGLGWAGCSLLPCLAWGLSDAVRLALFFTGSRYCCLPCLTLLGAQTVQVLPSVLPCMGLSPGWVSVSGLPHAGAGQVPLSALL